MRKILGIIVGVAVATIILLLVGSVVNSFNPTPPELMDPETPEDVTQRVARASNFTWWSVIFGLSLGAYIGGIVGAKIAKNMIFMVTTVIGTMLSFWAFYTYYIVYPEVTWVPITMLIVAFYFSKRGGKRVKRKQGF